MYRKYRYYTRSLEPTHQRVSRVVKEREEEEEGGKNKPEILTSSIKESTIIRILTRIDFTRELRYFDPG